MRHRIFIAINLPEEVKNQLVSFQKKWFDLPIRWTKKDNLHITLIFIGYADDAETAKVCKIVKDTASSCDMFFLKLDRICFGPPGEYGPESKKAPRMVWVEGEESQGLSKLFSILENFLVGGGRASASSARRFHPHITLGRIREWEWRRLEPEERPEINEEISLSFRVSSIEVMESQLKRGGPEYTILESVELK